MASENRLEEFQQVCESAVKLPSPTPDKWKLLQELARVALGQIALSRKITRPAGMAEAFSNAVAAGVVDDWPKMLWELFTRIGQGPLPDWWGPLSQGVQRISSWTG